MTEEQVAKLVVRADERCYDGEGINVTKEDVVRLLEERKRLLEASKSVAVMVGAANCEYDEQCIALASAIAYAEEAGP